MVKRIIKYYKRHKKLLIIDLLSAFIVAGVDLLLPYYSKVILDVAIPNKNVEQIFNIGIFLLSMFIVRSLFQFIVDFVGHMLGIKIENDMRDDLFVHMESMPTKYYDEHKIGRIMTRFTSHLRDVSEFAHHIPEDIFISIIMFIGSFFILLKMNLILTLIIFGIVLVGVTYSAYKRSKMMSAFRETKSKIAELNGALENSLSGIRVTKSFTNEAFEISKFKKINNDFKDAWKSAYWQMGWFHLVNQFLLNLLNLSAVVIGGYFVYLGKITAGELLAYTLYVSFFMQPIRRILNMFEMYQTGITGIERFIEMIDQKSDINDGPYELTDVLGTIQFKDATFKYSVEGDEVIHQLNLDINQGETIALVGESGVGKTTITQLIPRNYDLTSGEILVDGRNIKDYTLKSLRGNIGHVQQDVFIFYGSIKENIRYGRVDATFEEIVEAAKLANIHEFIMTLPKKYDTEVGERGVKLSGGQKQRLSLARVFLKNPPILILDEATSALDNQTEKQIQQSIEKIAKNRTTLIVAHRLTTIQNADRIIVLGQNGIIEEGNHEHLMNINGVYRRLYDASKNGFMS